MPDSKSRFTNRVDDYVKYRPHYPVAIVPYLQTHFGLTAGKLIADIGAGTGISAEIFLEAGYPVFAVEPNAAMRAKSVELLQGYTHFQVVSGSAEDTGLLSASVDAIVAGQAFHWFDVDKAKAEFKRILKPGGLVVLIWNERKTSTHFELAYEALIVKHAHDYQRVDHRNISAKEIEAFYFPEAYMLEIFLNHQDFDFGGLSGRLLSSSFMPDRNDAGYARMMADLKTLYDKYSRDNQIRITYETKVFAGII